MAETAITTIELSSCRVRAAQWGDGPADIIMLHDGLGSIRQWRGVPAALAAATGRTVLAYERAGHGGSTPVPTEAWPADWLHREASVLAELIGTIGAALPALVGHSDGGSIAAIHAMENKSGPVVLLAAHSFVEPMNVEVISNMRANPGPIIDGLSRSHEHPEAIFAAWSGGWVSEEFRSWDIRPQLAGLQAPALVVQGDADEYATAAQATETAAAIGDNATCLMLPDLGHLLHHQAPDLLVETVHAFLDDPKHSTTH